MRRILIVVALLSTFLSAPAVAQESPAPADLAVMTLNPLDLNVQELEGFGISTGGYLGNSQIGAHLGAMLNVDGATLATALATGFTSAYYLQLEQSAVLGDPQQGFSQAVTTLVLEYADPNAAATALQQFFTATTGQDAANLGDAGFQVSWDIAPAPGYQLHPGEARFIPVQQYLAFTLISPVSVPDQVIALSDRLREKIEIVSVGDQPDLSLHTLGFTGSEVELNRGFYTIGYGAPIRTVTQFEEEFTRFTERYDTVLNGFQQTQVIALGNGQRVQVRSFITGFATTEEAQAFAAAALDRQSQLIDPANITADSEFPSIGDQSSSLVYSLSSGHTVRQVTIQTDIYVATVDILFVDAGPAPDAQLLIDLAQAQASCLTTSCTAIELPASWHIEPTPEPTLEPTPEPTLEPTQASTPVANATPVTDATPIVPTPTIATPGFDAFQDPVYGIRIEYDPATWQFIDSDVEGTRSWFDLSNGTSTVSFVGDNQYAGDVAACFESAKTWVQETTGVDSLEQVLDTNGNPTVTVTAAAAQGIFAYTAADGTSTAVFLYCTTLGDEGATFLAIGTAPAAAFADQFPIMVELIQTTMLVTVTP